MKGGRLVDTAKTNKKYLKKVSILKKEIIKMLSGKRRPRKIIKDPYFYLWLSVLFRAIDDLRYDKWREDALNWIFSADYSINDTASFEWVCNVLDLDPERVRKKVKSLLEEKGGNENANISC